MNYVMLFGIVIPLQLIFMSTVLYLIRRQSFGREAGSWLRLTVKVFFLLLLVDVMSIFPVAGLAGAIVWLIGLKRLGGLDVQRTIMLSIILGIATLAILILVANHLQVPLGGQWSSR